MRARLEWFLPPSAKLAPRDEQRRALLVIGGSLLCALLAAFVALLQAFWGIAPAAAASATAALLAMALPFWVRRTGRWKTAARILTAAIWIPAFTVSLLTVGVLSAALYYLALAAAAAALTLGHRAGLTIGAINAVVVVAIYAAWLAGVPPLWTVDPNVARQSAIRGAFVLNLGLAALVAAYELLRAAMLRESVANEQRFRALADQGPDLIAELDPTGAVVAGNSGGQAFASAIAPCVRGELPDSGIHADDRSAVLEAFQSLFGRASASVGPLRWSSRDGHTAWIEASLTRYEAASERRTLVVARDVSPRVALETQLRQSQKMQAVGQLASGLAHDFNNLLMVIAGYSELVADRAKGDQQSLEATSEIRRATAQGASLTRRLLGLARPTKGTTGVLDASAVVRECGKLLGVLLGEGIALRIDVTPTPLPVRVDAGELEQVLVNLAANAKDAMGDKGTVHVTTSRRDGHAAIVIHDTGPGIPPENLDRIFEPFFTTRAPGKGTGLGLYIVYSVVTRLGGHVEVDSTVGRGTTFTVTLPLAEGSPGDVPTRATPAGGSEHLLVVEDRPELRGLLRQWLEKAGYHVHLA
ncbi:MAG: ATP-binding protein, partial [Gemmatimonadaceae bacterium]